MDFGILSIMLANPIPVYDDEAWTELDVAIQAIMSSLELIKHAIREIKKEVENESNGDTS